MVTSDGMGANAHRAISGKLIAMCIVDLTLFFSRQIYSVRTLIVGAIESGGYCGELTLKHFVAINKGFGRWRFINLIEFFWVARICR